MTDTKYVGLTCSFFDSYNSPALFLLVRWKWTFRISLSYLVFSWTAEVV